MAQAAIIPLEDQVKQALKERGYDIRATLSRGDGLEESNTIVYRAINDRIPVDRNGTPIIDFLAVKVFFPGAFVRSPANGRAKIESQGQKETDILGKLKHPNIAPLLHAETIDVMGFPFKVLATKYIDAPDLESRIREKEKINAEKIDCSLLPAMANVLQYLEQQQPPVLHRDIKPSNILFGPVKGGIGNQIYLIDFNVAQVGEGTSMTVVANGGYYPADAYSGRRTASQELCALGNTLIAALEGKDIQTIRDEQGKGLLEAVDVDKLALPPKLKLILQKMIADTPARRYQTASQVLADLQNPDVAVLETRVEGIVRSDQMQRALKKLQKLDELFAFHVPRSILDLYDDGQLEDHLERVYKQPEFVVQDPGDIKNYAKVGDRVRKRGAYKTKDKEILKEGERASITKIEGGWSLQKEGFHKIDDFFNVAAQTYTEIKTTFFSGVRDFVSEDPTHFNELGQWYQERLRSGKGIASIKVVYGGKSLFLKEAKKETIPENTEGLIAEQVELMEPYIILWQQGLGVEQNFSISSGSVQKRWRPEDFVLVRPNRIKLEEILK